MEVRIKAKLNPEQEKRLKQLHAIWGTTCNAKVFKKLLEVKL